jgi:hypothetical protein
MSSRRFRDIEDVSLEGPDAIAAPGVKLASIRLDVHHMPRVKMLS